MPAFLTHYACGVQGYSHLKDGAFKSALCGHRHVYHTGLAGPDLFFYSLWEMTRHGKMSIGRMMHKFRTGAYLRCLFRQACAFEGEERKIALAYFAGFLGHYCLDAHTHKLVYCLTEEESQARSLGRHFRYEAAIDGMCCENVLGMDITAVRQVELIRLSTQEKKVTAKLLASSINQVYPEILTEGKHLLSRRRMEVILCEYELITRALQDPTGFKEWMVQLAEKVYPGYPVASPLCINGNRYGLDKKAWDRFRRYFDRGVHMLDVLLPMAEAACEDPAAEETFFRRMGSWSYHGFWHEESVSDQPLQDLVANTKDHFDPETEGIKTHG